MTFLNIYVSPFKYYELFLNSYIFLPLIVIKKERSLNEWILSIIHIKNNAINITVSSVKEMLSKHSFAGRTV